jgi:hypothetical protein
MNRTPQDDLREYAQLNRKRKSEAISPIEYLRWQDIKRKLEKTFPGRPVPGGGGAVRMVVQYASEAELRSCVMANVNPIGLFVRTPFTPDPGDRFELEVALQDSGTRFAANVTVVSNNVGPGFSTENMGMGVRVNSEGALYALLMAAKAS